MPFAPAAGLLEDLAGVRLTVKRVERAAEASGAALAAASRSRAGLIAGRKLIPMRPEPLPDKLYIVIDGTGVPVTSKETAGREGKGEDGRARTREVKMAVFFTQDKLDQDGYPVRDRASSSYIATFEPAAAFQRLVRAEGIRRGADHVRQLTIIGDGAAWIWNLAAAAFPEATCIVDLYHAREHLMGIWQATRYASTGRQALRADRGACPPGSRLNGNRPQRPSTDRRDLVTATAARHADGIVGDRAVDRYGWSWPLPPAGTDPSLRREPSSSSPDRGPAGSWGHERLIGWRCLRALPLGSVREPAWPGHARQ